MRKNVPFYMVVIGILIILTVLYLWFGRLKNEREEDMARNTGTGYQAPQIRAEADQYRITNRNQQLGILAVGFVVLLVALVWRVGQRKHEPE